MRNEMWGVCARRVAVRHVEGLQQRGGGAAVPGTRGARLVRRPHGEGAARGCCALRHRAAIAQLAQGQLAHPPTPGANDTELPTHNHHQRDPLKCPCHVTGHDILCNINL
jgi:hypothetical protein